MPSPKPRLTLGRPITEPAQFHPTKVWTEGDYLYRYDPKLEVCRRSPIKPSATAGTMFFTARPAGAATKPKRRRPPKLVQAALWMVLAAAAVVFVYPLWPEAVYRWQQLHPAPEVSLTATAQTAGTATGQAAPVSGVDQIPITDNRLIVPKIGVDTPIVEGSNLKVLDKTEGVWHQTGSLEHGNFVLAGHRFRYLPPNTSTLYNLDKLAVGDLIGVDWLGKRTVYKVTQMAIVSQNDVAILDPTSTPRLTLYSCNDIRQTQRVVAIAEPLPAP